MATAFPNPSSSTVHSGKGRPPWHEELAISCDGGAFQAATMLMDVSRLGHRSVRRLIAGVAVAVFLVAGLAGMNPASGHTQPHRQPDAVAYGKAPQHIHTCDDPDNPCYTATQMHFYLVHRTHHFYRLSHSFRFPARFIHLAQAAHAAWCRHHPARCTAQKARWMADAIANPNDRCGPGWWCHERGLISCSGGGMVPYWSCEGAYHQSTARQLDSKLSTTDKVLIVGGDTMVCFLLPPGAPIVIGSGLIEMFNVWITSSEGTRNP
jgi:hypothetical protein